MDILADLNEPQRQAVLHLDGPLLVLAGAGSGKTRVITRRVAQLIRQGVPPWNILAITFTNRAAGEMVERVESLGTPRGATICTFHALCARLLREFAAEADLCPNYTIYDRDDQLKLVKQAMARAEVSAERFTPARVHTAISNAKNELKSPAVVQEQATDFFGRRVGKVYAEYEKFLAANNALDFDDLLLRMAGLLRDRPDIRAGLSQRYRYILIDEYQDTNRAQYVLVHGIAVDHENLCATGDPDQSIYAWRGADIRNILEFEADYPNAAVIRLEENYRSTTPILAAASRLIDHNVRRRAKALWTHRAGGADVRVVYCDDEHAEAALIAQRIGRYRREEGDCSGVAVFYRINALSRVIEEQFIRDAIPYRVARGTEFYNRKEVRDVLAYLKLLANPADDLSCLRIVNTPPRGIGKATVLRLTRFAEIAGEPLLAICRRVEEVGLGTAATRKVKAFAELMDSLARGETARAGPRKVIERVVEETGLEGALRDADDPGAPGESQALRNIEELISTAAEFEARMEDASLADYLHQVSLVSDVDHFEGGGGGAVTLMTLHAAKGLEFPVVFMVACEDGMLPFRRADRQDERRRQEYDEKEADRLEEERRLAFVGMTRTKDLLTLTCARSRMLRGMSMPQIESRFLRELLGEGVVVEDVVSECREVHRPRGRAGGGFYAEAREREAIEAMEDDCPLPPDYEYLGQGCRVYHPTFGPGTVLRIRQPWPQTRVDVKFDSVGRKTLVLSAAKLEMME